MMRCMLDKNVYDYRVREKCSTETRVYFCALCANAADEIGTARHWGFGTFEGKGAAMTIIGSGCTMMKSATSAVSDHF